MPELPSAASVRQRTVQKIQTPKCVQVLQAGQVRPEHQACLPQPAPGPHPSSALCLGCFFSSSYHSSRSGSPHGTAGDKIGAARALLSVFLFLPSFLFLYAVNTSHDWVPIKRCGSLNEPGAFEELDENSVHECILAKRLHQHHSLLS